MDEVLPKKIARSVSRYRATGRLRPKKDRAPTQGLVGIRRAAAQRLVDIRRARGCRHSGRTMTKKLMTLAVALASLPAIASAQGARSQAPSYCFDLSRVVDLAMTKERFASIAGRPRQGSYVGTSLVLAGWKDCSLYG